MSRKGSGPRGERPGLVLRAKRRLGLLADLEITAFPSAGRGDWLRANGRLIEKEALRKPTPDSGLLANVLNTIRRLESDEIPGARVLARFRGVDARSVTDGEGYFSLRLDLDERVEPGWHEVVLEVEDPFEHGLVEGTARCLVPPPDADFAVVSDLDDTIIHTHAANRWGQARMLFGRNARTRPPFAGVAAFYRALARGPDGAARNPLFYLSRSGWNLFDVFASFMAAHEIPEGPFFMQDLRIVEARSEALGLQAPKLERCAILMENYPDFPFVLIGDSGQRDPEVYREVVDRHPGRVRAIYIRDVTPDERDREVEAIAEELAGRGVPMVLAQDTLVTAEHAAGHGLIAPDAVEEVRREVERERS